MGRQGFRYAVVLAAFHGGGVVSWHRTREAAERRARRKRMADCVCGCTHVVRVEDLAHLPEAIDCTDP